MSFRSVFFGTPEFAVPALSALHESTQVVGVVCQPDRRAGRGMKLCAPPVKQWALAHGLDVFQPERVRDGQLEAWLRARDADVAVVAAYGRILTAGVLGAPRRGCINLHASILPAYRGAAPIQWALMRGETETGISLMQMDEGLDTGPVYAIRKIPIRAETNAGELTRELAELAAEVVRHELLEVLAGRAAPAPQDGTRATLAPPIRAEHAQINWGRTAGEIVNQVRGLAPEPGAFTYAGARRLKLLEASVSTNSGGAQPPGTVRVGASGHAEVSCGSGSLQIERAQPEGGKAQSGRDLVNGRLLGAGLVLAMARSSP